jgi:hypothetical protein
MQSETLLQALIAYSELDCSGNQLGDVEGTVQKITVSLRALRLWHWNQCCVMRNLALEGERLNQSQKVIAKLHAQANEHLGFVQALNEFFPLYDTAEKDSAK